MAKKKSKKHNTFGKTHKKRFPDYLKHKYKQEKLIFKPFKNMEFIPAYLMVPKFIMDQTPEPIRTLPRSKRKLLFDKNARSVIESDLFLEFIIDSYAFMVWQYMKPGEYMEIYSGYDPAWTLAHAAPIWIGGMVKVANIPTFYDWFKNDPLDEEMDYISLEGISHIISSTVAYIMKVRRYDEMLKIVDEYRCFEDYDDRYSFKKADFIRDWYHMRTKHPTISLDDYMEDYMESHNGQEWDIIDESPSFENEIDTKDLSDRFLSTLSEKDRQILELRLEGATLEKISEKLGYANHSGVLKRIRKIGKAFEEYADVDYGFDGRHII